MSCAPDFGALVKDITRSRRLQASHATGLPILKEKRPSTPLDFASDVKGLAFGNLRSEI